MPDRAADLFAQGVECCNPAMIREGVAGGARIDELAGRSVTPLQVVLNKCARDAPGSRECVETLVELGCPIDGEPHRTPTVLECVAHRREERESLRLLRVFVPLGVNVNAIDPSSGDTALSLAVVRHHLGVVRFLLDHGADPTIKNGRGVSPIDWLRARIAKTSQMFSECWKHRNALSLITGEPLPRSEKGSVPVIRTFAQGLRMSKKVQ